MENVLVFVILVVIIISAVTYVVKSKKKGIKCVGCPYAKECSQNNENNSCSCNK